MRMLRMKSVIMFSRSLRGRVGSDCAMAGVRARTGHQSRGSDWVSSRVRNGRGDCPGSRA
jgi:hypothetical protein